MAKQNAVWGIDIGQCALKALRCTLDSDGETIVADKYDFIEYPKILSQPDSEPEELIKDALEQFLSRNDVVGDRVAISVSGQAGLSRFFKPPPVEVKTLPDIVKYEVKQQIPFPIEDVIWDWQQLGGSVVDGRAIDAEVGLFAMKREAVYRALRPFDDAGVEIDVVQLSPLSIFNVVCHDTIENTPDPEDFDPENPPESIVVMSMGTDTTDLIVTNGIKLWLRNIPIGGNHFTKQLSREMKLTQAKAEHLKRNARVSENPKAIFKAMRPVFNDLVNEVQRSLTFFQSMEKTAILGQIMLLGNAAKLPGLRQFLSKQLEIDIAKISEFNKLKGGDVTTQPTFANNLLSYAPCYGLCLQGLKKAKINTNLLPNDIVVERIIRAKKPWVLAAVGALSLGLVLGFFFTANNWWRVEDAYADADSVTWKTAMTKVAEKKRTSDTFVTDDAAMKVKLDQFNKIATELASASEKKTTWIELYSALSQAFPVDARVEKARKEGIERIDPQVIPFEDREELYVDHIESKYFEDLQAWLNADVQDIYDKMVQITDSGEIQLDETPDEEVPVDDTVVEGNAPSTGFEDEDVSTALTGPLGGKSGWVIEIKGHHFHNSDTAMRKLYSGKTFLAKTLLKNLLKEEVTLPTNGQDEVFTYADIGISYPTITQSVARTPKTIYFDPTAPAAGVTQETGGGGGGRDGGLMGGGGGMMGGGRGGMTPGGGGIGAPGGGGTTLPAGAKDKNTFEVHEYNFVVQLAWTPRSAKERLAAREERLKLKAEADAAKAAAVEGEVAADAAAPQ